MQYVHYKVHTVEKKTLSLKKLKNLSFEYFLYIFAALLFGHYIYFIILFIKNLFIMKKFMILLAVACLIFVSCDNTPKATEPEEPKCEFTLLLDKWATFEELNEEGQIALIAEIKAYFDECCKEKCEAKEGEEVKEVCPEKEAFIAQWNDFANLDLEAQKAIIEKCIEHKKCCKEKEAKAEISEEIVQE